jgi:hypothetical protein
MKEMDDVFLSVTGGIGLKETCMSSEERLSGRDKFFTRSRRCGRSRTSFFAGLAGLCFVQAC